MKSFFVTIALLLFPLLQAFAHEEETEITNLAEADWVGPMTAIGIIAGAIVLARALRKRSSQKIISNDRAKYI